MKVGECVEAAAAWVAAACKGGLGVTWMAWRVLLEQGRAASWTEGSQGDEQMKQQEGTPPGASWVAAAAWQVGWVTCCMG